MKIARDSFLFSFFFLFCLNLVLRVIIVVVSKDISIIPD